MKSLMAVVVAFFVVLLTGCASTSEPEIKYVYVEKVSVAQASATSSSDERTTRGGSSYFVTRMRVAKEGASVVSAGNCGGLTIDNYTDVSVIDGVTLHRVSKTCQTGNHGADGWCLKKLVSCEKTKDNPNGCLVERQVSCNTDNSLPFCRQEPGRIAGEWACLSKALISLGEKELGDAKSLVPETK